MNKKRFKIKEKHLKLLKRAYVSWHDCEFGSPSIDPKRPYGNSDVERDIAEILGWEINDGELSEKQRNKATKLHNETETVLQICLSQLKFETGEFEADEYSNNWKKI